MLIVLTNLPCRFTAKRIIYFYLVVYNYLFSITFQIFLPQKSMLYIFSHKLLISLNSYYGALLECHNGIALLLLYLEECSYAMNVIFTGKVVNLSLRIFWYQFDGYTTGNKNWWKIKALRNKGRLWQRKPVHDPLSYQEFLKCILKTQT